MKTIDISRAAKRFKKQHRRNVSRQYVPELVSKFRETKSIPNKKRQIEPSLVNEATTVTILEFVELYLILGTIQLPTVSGASRISLQCILKRHIFYPYKIQLTQELREDEFHRCFQFSYVINAHANTNLQWFKHKREEGNAELKKLRILTLLASNILVPNRKYFYTVYSISQDL